MEEEFQILFDYLKVQKEEKAGLSYPEAPDPEKKEEECVHSEQVMHEGYYVCTGCGMVMESIFLPEVDWEKRCTRTRTYSSTDRITAVDRHLRGFLEKADISHPVHPIQEKLRFMKIESRFKSINYAIALTCILQDDVSAQEKL